MGPMSERDIPVPVKFFDPVRQEVNRQWTMTCRLCETKFETQHPSERGTVSLKEFMRKIVPVAFSDTTLAKACKDRLK